MKPGSAKSPTAGVGLARRAQDGEARRGTMQCSSQRSRSSRSGPVRHHSMVEPQVKSLSNMIVSPSCGRQVHAVTGEQGEKTCCGAAIAHLPETPVSALHDRFSRAFRLSGEVTIAVQSRVVTALWISGRVFNHGLAGEEGRRDGDRDRKRLSPPRIRSSDTDGCQIVMLRRFRGCCCQN